MKIIFIARALDSSRVIADALLKEKLIDGFILETGSVAKKKKALRMLKRKPLWRILLLPFDLAFLIFMNRKANNYFYKHYPKIPSPPVNLLVDDANEEKCLQHLRKEQPDIILIFGTAILKKPILSIPKIATLNIHGAIVPKYRNVHGEFWAIAHKKYDELGTSLLITNEGIDNGDIVRQRTLGIDRHVSVSEAKMLVFEDTLKLVREELVKIRNGSLTRSPQNTPPDSIFQTPTFIDWLKFRVKI